MFPPLHLFFSATATNRFYFYFFILFISLTSSYSLTPFTKSFCLPLIPSQSNPHLLLQSQLLSQTLSSLSMAPKSKKSSYILSTDAFHLTHWNGVVRLAEALPLTYKLQQHLSDGARARSVIFFSSDFPF